MGSDNALKKLANSIGVPEVTLQSILVMFYNEHHSIRKQTQDWIERNAQSELVAYVHKLKGASGSLKMHALRQQVIQIENRLRLDEPISVEDFEPLYLEMDLVIKRYQLEQIFEQS